MGDLNDRTLISQHTQEADIIFHTATADHLPSVEAVLEGIHARSQEGKETIFIHTSGTSVLDDNAKGAFKSSKIYHDEVQAEFDSVPDNAPHREINLASYHSCQNLKAVKREGENRDYDPTLDLWI